MPRPAPKSQDAYLHDMLEAAQLIRGYDSGVTFEEFWHNREKRDAVALRISVLGESAHKIDKAESTIDWNQPAEVIARRVRAFDPFPGAATTLGADAIKVWSCEIDSCSRTLDAACGQILSIDADGIGVACGAGSLLRLTVLQRAGGKRLPAADFLRGFPLAPGMVLGAAP